MLRQLGQLYRCTRSVPKGQIARRIELSAKRWWMSRIGHRLIGRHHPPPIHLVSVLPTSLFRPRQHLVRRTPNGPCLSQLGTEFPLTPPVDWLCEKRPGTRHLDRLALHYHEFLECLPFEEGWPIIDDWIERNSPWRVGCWLDSWNSYAISIRCVCWFQWWERHRDRLSPEQREQIGNSLFEQVFFLERNLETDICGNHLIKNLRCLLWASSFFEGEDAKRWRKDALKMLDRELSRQFLSDGMHYELSPAYHCQVVGDLIECAWVLDGAAKGKLIAALEPMMAAMRTLTHPDGLISLFSDGGLHMVYSPAEIEEAWQRRTASLPTSQSKSLSENANKPGASAQAADGLENKPGASAQAADGLENKPGASAQAADGLQNKPGASAQAADGLQIGSPSPLAPLRGEGSGVRGSHASTSSLSSDPSTINHQPSTDNPLTHSPTHPLTYSPTHPLPASGYYNWRTERQWLLVDCGAVCADALPAHGHGDMLAFEWDVDGHRTIVDNGVFQYEAGERRLFDRSVASHNTVQVDSQDQAEFIGSFRTGWRYRARCETVRSDDGSFELIGSHDAYQCGSQRITHRRRFFATSDRFTIEDRLILCDRHGNEKTEPSIASAASSDRSAAVSGQVARARFLFHDACRLEQVSDSSIRIRVGSSSIVMQASTVIRIIPAEWSPDFGVRVATHLVEATFASVPGSASFQFALEA